MSREGVDVDFRNGAMNQKIVVESHLMQQKTGGAIGRQLVREGWVFAGWDQSQVDKNGVAGIFVRVNPLVARSNRMTTPRLEVGNFDGSDLGLSLYGVLRSIYAETARRAYAVA